MSLNESFLEDAALTWFGELNYSLGHRSEMATIESQAERSSFGEMVLIKDAKAMKSSSELPMYGECGATF